MEVLTEAVPRRGEMVAADTAWWELQDMLPEHVLAVRFWGETTSLWWRWARDAVGETEVLARLHVPGGHTSTFLVHLAWMGLPDGSEGEDEDGEEPDVPDDDPDIPDEDIPGILAGLDELLAVLANIHAE